MINELYHLAKTLENNEIAIEQSHEMYLPLIPKQFVRIWLSDDGTVCGIEQLSEKTMASMKTYGNNHNSFPVFNIKRLYRITDKPILDELNSIEEGSGAIDVKKLQSWCTQDNWIKDSSGKVERSLRFKSQELVTMLGGDLTSEENVIFKAAQLSNAFFAKESNGFRKAFEHYIFEALERGRDRKLLLDLLFHQVKREKEREQDRGHSIAVVVDVRQWKRYSSPVASAQTTAWINQRLLEASIDKPQNPSLKKKPLDAFGEAMGSAEGTMPVVMIDENPISLRTMFQEHHCQTRYQTIGADSYPLSTENRRTVAGAMEWIAAPERKGITWDTVGDRVALFVYPTRLPAIPIKFTAIFGPSAQTPSPQSRFESMAKQFVDAMKGIPVEAQPEYIHIIMHQKTDKNRASTRGKLIFTHYTSPERLIQAANDWSIGCRNLPELDVGETAMPFPLEVAAVINSVWQQNGELASQKEPVKRLKYGQGIELLLDMLPQSAVRNFLHIAVEHSSGLIRHLGNQLHGAQTEKSKTKGGQLERNRNAAAQILSVLGLLLYKCKKRKENYMEELAYLIGQLLHVSDELHTLYCKVVRGGNIPLQLAGGALFVTAGEMPYQALSQLSVRMNPYIMFAKRYRHHDEAVEKGEESWRAKWLLGIYQNLSDKIYPRMDNTLRFGDYERAQLFIGYMASLPKKEIPDTIQNRNENKKDGGMTNEERNETSNRPNGD